MWTVKGTNVPISGGGGTGSSRPTNIQTLPVSTTVINEAATEKPDDSLPPIIPPGGGDAARDAESTFARVRRTVGETAQTAANVRQGVQAVREAPENIRSAVSTIEAIPEQVRDATAAAGEVAGNIRDRVGAAVDRIRGRGVRFDTGGEIPSRVPTDDLDAIISADNGRPRYMPLDRPAPLDPLARRYSSAVEDLPRLPSVPSSTPRPFRSMAGSEPSETPRTFRSVGSTPEEMGTITSGSAQLDQTPRSGWESARSYASTEATVERIPVGTRLVPPGLRQSDLTAMSDAGSEWSRVEPFQPFRLDDGSSYATRGESAIGRFGQSIMSRIRGLGGSNPTPVVGGLRSDLSYEGFTPRSSESAVPSRGVEQMGIESERLIPSRTVATQAIEAPYTVSRPTLQWTGEGQIVRGGGRRGFRTLNPFRQAEGGGFESRVANPEATQLESRIPAPVTPESAVASEGLPQASSVVERSIPEATAGLGEEALGATEMADITEAAEAIGEAAAL